MNYNAPVLYKSQKSSGVADKAKLNFRIGALGEKISAKVTAAAEKIEKHMKAFNGEDRESKDQIRERKFEKHLIDNAAMSSRVISTLSDIAADSEESRLLVLEQQEKIDQLYHQTLNAPLRNAQSLSVPSFPLMATRSNAIFTIIFSDESRGDSIKNRLKNYLNQESTYPPQHYAITNWQTK